jgi:hypothetical protein
MTLILLRHERLATFRDTKGISVMRHKNSVFHDVLKHVPWGEFDRLVDEHEADFRVRRLTTKSQFVALLYGQLSGAASLRELAAQPRGAALPSRRRPGAAFDAGRRQCGAA